MRSEKQVLDEIIRFAQKNRNVKAVVLNGSRANPNAPRDFMMDYDVAFYVEDLALTKEYTKNQSWIKDFGNLMILQHNNSSGGEHIFLMQFDDSVRIDLSFHDVRKVHREIKADSLSVVIYDPENIVGKIPAPDEHTYYIKKPTRKKWDEALSDLWWLQVYVAKELWRDEIPLAKELYEIIINHLRDLICWHIAAEKDWKVNVGHGAKWFKHLLPPEIYEKYIYFYASADLNEQWEKLLNIGAFIRSIAIPLSEKLGYEYPLEYDKNVSAYIRKIRVLPSGAESLPE